MTCHQRRSNLDITTILFFEYDSKTNAIQMIKTDKSLANRKEVARYDVNGNKLNSPQKGVNIILYSDGTTNKVIEK